VSHSKSLRTDRQSLYRPAFAPAAQGACRCFFQLANLAIRGLRPCRRLAHFIAHHCRNLAYPRRAFDVARHGATGRTRRNVRSKAAKSAGVVVCCARSFLELAPGQRRAAEGSRFEARIADISRHKKGGRELCRAKAYLFVALESVSFPQTRWLL
jgi:hypothetical protein